MPKPVSLALEECKSVGELEATIKDFQGSRSQYFISQDAVNGLAFQLMLAKKNDLGLAVLEFNAEEFSSQPWVYGSLEEAYSMAGNKEKAVENLKKLLELDPQNAFAKKKLKELGIIK